MTASRRHSFIVASVIALPILIFAAIYGFGLRINLTPSYPIGLWQIEALDRPVVVGGLIFICPPVTAAFELGFERGYVRRGLCARTLLRFPRLRILDEPTENLDAETAELMLMAVLASAQDRTMIIITHDVGVAAKFAHRTVRMAAGKIIPMDQRPGIH